MTEQNLTDFRLPSTAFPERYDLRLAPDLTNFSFSGEETVTVEIREPVDTLVLNAVELDIDSATIQRQGEQPLTARVTLDVETERLSLQFPVTLTPGRWTLQTAFRGTLNDKLAGFYRSTYRDADGVSHVIATTQFESTDARRAFPCWDEPAFKAVFAVTLTVDAQLTALSNGKMVRETPSSQAGKKNVAFADTIAMSTYLVAFVVGEFEAEAAVMAAGVPLQVWSVKGKTGLTHFARDVGAFSLAFFADYYGISYPGQKVDLIAIPDFAAGAMENLGAVTFRETALLVDERTATHGDLERVAVVVAHELAHMWFGDLVTMRWWNGIWLNEAFATFMEMLAVDAWKPEWETWVGFGADRAGALLIDGLRSTRPIEYPVHRPEEAQAMFDTLTYQKGAAVLRMLQQYLGEQTFREGVGLYLREHAYGNTETEDLWNALEQMSGQPVRQAMDSWIFQEGYPLVSVEAEQEDRALHLSQQRFLYLSDGEASKSVWQVPVILRTASPDGESETRVLLSEPRSDVDLSIQTDWVVANAGGHGFYRVRYSPDLLQRLMPHIQASLSAIERFNLVSDTWSATMAGYSSLADFLDLTALFHEESDESVWSMLLGTFGSLRRMMGTEVREVVAGLVRDRLGPVQRRLGWDLAPGESDRTRGLRGMLLGSLGTLGDDRAIQQEAVRRYSGYLSDRGSVDPDVVPALIGILAYTGDAARYEEFWHASREAKTPQEEQRYLFALAGFSHLELLQQTMARTLDGEVRTQDAPFLMRSLLANKECSEQAWEFVKAHWDEMVARYPENTIPRMCEGVTALTRPELEADVRQFFATHEVKQAGKQLDQHLERLHMGVRFRQRESTNLVAYRVTAGN